MVGYHKRSDPATIDTKAEIDRLKETGEMGLMKYVRITMPDEVCPDHHARRGLGCRWVQ